MTALLKFASDVIEKDGVRLVVLSNETKDRDGDVVRAAGWDLGNFSKAPRLMSCHNYGQLTAQIGEWRNVRVDAELKALVGEPHYYTGQGNAEADWAAYLASIGQATYSVGFNPQESQPLKGERGFEFTSQELLECSHVPIPSNPEALQLMAKAFQLRQEQPKQRQQGRTVRKWDSQFMPGSDDFYGPMDQHCLVPGCDDASQAFVPICSEHLKVLINADPEPAGGAEDDIELQQMAYVARMLSRRAKAGRVVSAANMDKLHTALKSLHDVHDGTCDDAECAMAPATERDKQAKAADPAPTEPPPAAQPAADKTFSWGEWGASIEDALTKQLEGV